MQSLIVIVITLLIIALILHCIFNKKEDFNNNDNNEITVDMGLPKIKKKPIPDLYELKYLENNLFDVINSDIAIKAGCNPKGINLIKKALKGETSLENVGNYFLNNKKECEALKNLVYKL